MVWTGEVVDTNGGMSETESPALVMEDGTLIELWGEGIALPNSDRLLKWDVILEALRERRVQA